MFGIQRRYLSVARSRGFKIPAGYDDLAPQFSAAEKALDFEVRLCALEYFFCNLLAEVANPLQLGNKQIDGMHRRILAHVTRQKTARLSPMYTDLPASELQYAVRCLVSMHRELLGLPRRLDP